MSQQNCKRKALVGSGLAWLLLVVVQGALMARLLLLPILDARSRSDINDLSLSAQDILRHSFDIANVELLVAAPHPTHRIIHITDCHSIPRKRLTTVLGSLAPTQIHDLHRALSDRVELFQESQVRLLRWLVDFHDVREVFSEGVYEENLSKATKRVEWFRKVAPGRDCRRRTLAHVSAQVRESDASGRDSTELRRQQRKLEDIRDRELNLGAIGDLLVDRPFVKMRAAEDATAFADFMSMKPGRRMESAYGAARDAAIVRNLLSRGPCAVIVLGSAHDLSAEVKKQGRGQCEYLRVTPKDFPPPFEEIYAACSKAHP